jgi:predicted O-methyltransferase YrrM
VEVGTFLGYSAIWTALNLPPGSGLICVEFEPRHVEVAPYTLHPEPETLHPKPYTLIS